MLFSGLFNTSIIINTSSFEKSFFFASPKIVKSYVIMKVELVLRKDVTNNLIE